MIGSLITGAVVGWIAGQLMDGESGLLRNIFIGVFGSGLGGLVFGLVGFTAHGFLANLIVSVAGACLFIWIGRKLFCNDS